MTAVQWLEQIAKSIVINGGDLGEDYPALMVHIEQAKEIERQQLESADRNGANRVQYYRDLEYGGAEYWEDDNLPQTFEQHYSKLKQ